MGSISISRQQQRALLRKIAEIAILRVLGRVPHRFRRHAARVYGNASYRVLSNIPTPRWSKYARTVPHPGVTEWIAGEYSKFIDSYTKARMEEAQRAREAQLMKGMAKDGEGVE